MAAAMGKNEESALGLGLKNCVKGSKDNEDCKGGRGVWGAIWEQSIPVGENTKYRAPKTLEAYEALSDGTSHQEVRKSKDKNGCTRFFMVGDRGDMKQTVKPMLKELGICEASDSTTADMVWTRPWEVIAAFFRQKMIHPGAVVNSVAGLPQQIGQKMSLARLHVACMERSGYDPLEVIPDNAHFCRFTQRAFALRRDAGKLQMPYKRFAQYNQQLDQTAPESHRIWILKPQGGFNQVGIHMYSLDRKESASADGTLAWLSQRVPDGTWVLQEYIMNPMTYQGHKFDLRIWAVVTSMDPLRIHLLGTGIPKVSQWRFSKAKEDVKEQCIHVLLPGTTECFMDRRAQVLRPYPTRTNNKQWYDAMDPRGEKFWTTVAWPSIEWIIVELLLLARDSVLHIDHQIKRKGLQYKRIFFLSPDVVLDRSGQASMVEVNTNGYLIGNLHKDFFPLFEEQRAVMRVIGANGFPQAHKYNVAMKKQVASFCKKAECTTAATHELHELVHEDMHATQSWYRIFPTRESHEYTLKLKMAPQYARSFTLLDHINFAWLERKWTPKHTHDENGTVIVLDQGA